MKYLIADIVTEFNPKYEYLKYFSKPFEYYENQKTEIKLNLSRKFFQAQLSNMAPNIGAARTESFAMYCLFNKEILRYNAMTIHSSAIIYDGNAYLFSAPSGGGKSTQTRLLKELLKDEISYINDDKPVVRIVDGKPVAYGTPFDGGSGIACNRSAPLKAVFFINKSNKNSLKEIHGSEIVSKLYRSANRSLDGESAMLMLSFMDTLIKSGCRFYSYDCMNDVSSAEYLNKYLFNNENTV